MPVNLIIRNPLDWDALAIARNANGANRRELSDYVRFLKAQAVWTDLTFFRDFANAKSLNHSFGPNINFTRNSVATYFDAGGTLRTAIANEPRFDHDPSNNNSLGLLIEEARTNSIRNSQAGGSTAGVIGSGGVMPTNWQISVPTGITREIVGTGTLNGFSYIDIKFGGTNTSGSSDSFLVGFDTTTQIVAASGQTWTGSIYIALVGGSFSGASAPAVDLVERNVGGSYLAGTQTNISAATSTLARFSATRTFNQATTERTTVQVAATVPNGNTVDITLRIAAPQLEQGAFPTSYIPTTSAAVTRSADSAVVTPISSFYNASEGTLFAEASNFGDGINTTSVAFSEDNNSNERFQLRVRGGGLAVVAAGVISAGTSNIAPATNVASKKAGAAKLNDFAISTNGAAVETDPAGNMPNVTHLVVGALATSLVQPLNGHIRKVAYYPKRFSNALLQTLTT